jgi:hypothetical protein
MVDTIHTPLDRAPKGFHVVDVGGAVDVFLSSVLDGLVVIAHHGQPSSYN